MAIFNVASLLTKVNGNRLATLFFVLAGVIFATPASACDAPRSVVMGQVAAIGDGFAVTSLTQTQIKAFAALVAEKNAGTVNADEVLLFRWPQRPDRVLIVGFRDGCKDGSAWAAWEIIKRRVVGQGT